MAGIQQEIMVTEANLEPIRAELRRTAPDQADALEIGCRTWSFVNAEGFPGRITVWPDGGRAALASKAANHWGVWNEGRRKLRLDDGDIYNAQGGVGEDA